MIDWWFVGYWVMHRLVIGYWYCVCVSLCYVMHRLCARVVVLNAWMLTGSCRWWVGGRRLSCLDYLISLCRVSVDRCVGFWLLIVCLVGHCVFLFK